ncbi:MAG TPA: hypothetical protein DGB32_04325 [Dehalococcoidia bacterium]|nr:hypothetical protein [Chloroflexota bacterium]HCV27529.1 hypothetical protein [Dehalococcoidia bacterium]
MTPGSSLASEVAYAVVAGGVKAEQAALTIPSPNREKVQDEGGLRQKADALVGCYDKQLLHAAHDFSLTPTLSRRERVHGGYQSAPTVLLPIGVKAERTPTASAPL